MELRSFKVAIRSPIACEHSPLTYEEVPAALPYLTFLQITKQSRFLSRLYWLVRPMDLKSLSSRRCVPVL